MELPRHELERVARIARIPLPDEDVDRFRDELEAILEDFGRLADAVDPADVHGDDAPAGGLRDDEVLRPDPATAAAIRAAFPEAEDDLLKVPRGL